MIANQVTTATGSVRAVCEWCARQSRPVRAATGRIGLAHLAAGWSVVPYPASTVHADGSTGDLWTCPRCNDRRRGGGHLAPHPDRAAARAALAFQLDQPPPPSPTGAHMDRTPQAVALLAVLAMLATIIGYARALARARADASAASLDACTCEALLLVAEDARDRAVQHADDTQHLLNALTRHPSTAGLTVIDGGLPILGTVALGSAVDRG